MKRIILLAAMLVLLVITVVINLWFEEFRAWGALCLFGMVLLSIIGRIKK